MNNNQPEDSSKAPLLYPEIESDDHELIKPQKYLGPGIATS